MIEYTELLVRRMVYILVVVATLASVVVDGLFAAGGPYPERYVRKDIIIIPWGDEKGEFGYPTLKRPGVPQAWLGGFDIDDDGSHVYIADSGNARVLKYTTDGEFVGELDLSEYVDGIGSLAVDAYDNIYVVDDVVFKHEYLVVVDSEGQLLREKADVPFLHSDSQKNIVVDKWGWDPEGFLYDVNSDSFTEIDRPASFHTQFSESQNFYYHVVRSTPASRICRYNRQGEVLDEILTPVPVSGIFGLDGAGNYYCSGALSVTSYLDIIKVAPDGEVLAVLEMWRFAIEYKVKIDNVGNIYLMSHRQCPWREEEFKKGFRLIKYEPVKNE